MRQLLIGAETPVAVSYTNGLLANGAVDIQKKDSNGEITPLVPGDTVADAKEIRIVQGTAVENIVSPWIPGKNIIAWGGKSYLAPVASTSTLTVTGTAGNAGQIEVKFIRKDIQPQEFFTVNVDIASGAVQNDQPGTIKTAYDGADLPDWLASTCTDGGANVVTFTGSKNGDTVASGAVWDGGSVVFDMIVNEVEAIATSVYTPASNVVDPLPGIGDGYDLINFEESLRGSNFGYYNRLKLPNTPSTFAQASGTYDMYSIVATKDGSTSPQIKGVDNLMEIYVAIELATPAVTTAFQGALNPYMNAQGFANVTL